MKYLVGPGSKLTQLSLRNCRLGAAGIDQLCTYLSSSSLTSLDLAANAMTHDHARQLAEVLESNTVMKILDLQHNCIGHAGADSLEAMLQTNHSLRRLNLHENMIPEDKLDQINTILLSNGPCLVLTARLGAVSREEAKEPEEANEPTDERAVFPEEVKEPKEPQAVRVVLSTMSGKIWAVLWCRSANPEVVAPTVAALTAAVNAYKALRGFQDEKTAIVNAAASRLDLVSCDTPLTQFVQEGSPSPEVAVPTVAACTAAMNAHKAPLGVQDEQTGG